MNSTIYHGDCVEIMKMIDSCSIDSIVCDPPAGIGFMGKEWDHHKGGRDDWIEWMQGVAEEALRVLKPGGHALVWAIPRTSHWTATAWENAGFEIRDRIAHVFGSGFPKSMDISKAIDKAAGAEREVVGKSPHAANRTAPEGYDGWTANDSRDITAPATEAARQWAGWGTAMKPAVEDWWLLRKPLIGTVAENVLTHGTGGLNIDGCRVATEEGGRPLREVAPLRDDVQYSGNSLAGRVDGTLASSRAVGSTDVGRWPANLILEDCDEVRAVFPVTTSGAMKSSTNRAAQDEPGSVCYGTYGGKATSKDIAASSGSAARFFHQFSHDEDDVITGQRLFYCGKASKRDRDEGLEGFEKRVVNITDGHGRGEINTSKGGDGIRENRPRANVHPTVKPTSLMQNLCRLITPPGGTILDPFMGSGSTGKAAMLEGFNFIGIEREAEYVEIARARIQHAQKQCRQPKQNELFPEAA